MALTPMQKDVGDGWVADTSVTATFGTVYAFRNDDLKLGLVCFNAGNSSTASGTIDISSIPAKNITGAKYFSALSKNNGYLGITTNNSKIVIENSEAYAVGQLIYSIA